MSKLQALRERKRDQAAAIGKLRDKMNADGYTATAADEAEWGRLTGEYKTTCAQLEREEFADEAVNAGRAPNNGGRIPSFEGGERAKGGDGARAEVTEEHRALAIQAWFRGNCSDPGRFPITDDHRAAIERVGMDTRGWGVPGAELVLRLRPTETVAPMQGVFRSSHPAFARANALSALNGYKIGATALSSIDGQAGGTLMAPESMVNTIEVNMLSYSGILQAAEIMRTATRERVRWPTINDTSNKGRRLGENDPVTSTSRPATGAVYWDVYKYTSDEILVPYELLNGTPYNLAVIIAQLCGERIGRKFNDDGTTGTGGGQPKGIVTAATTFGAAAATSIAWDDLDDLIAAVDPAYRTGAAFMFHDAIRNKLKKLKDGNGRPLWADGPNGTEPVLLKGYPWFINQSMDSTVASGKKSVLFGQVSKYKVRQVDTIRIYRLIERHRENDQDAFMAFAEMDGNLLDAGTAPVKVLTH
jgi:HK97 family phage major capsid protein